jgi:hypothetical protein
MPKKTASVLRRVPGNSEWVVEDYRIKAKGFDVGELQAMAGGNCLFEAFALDRQFCVICDEEGRLKALPIGLGLQLKNGTILPVFGPFAVVGKRDSKNGNGLFEYCGLDPEDFDFVQTKFPWVTV